MSSLKSTTKRGRPHNAEGARETILNAAEQVFAEHGFDGTRVDVIAEVAGYNKSLIFQYFGDKVKLYASVIRRADEQINGFQTQALSELLTTNAITDVNQLKSLLHTFIGVYIDYLIEHPNFVRILNWEIAEGWQTYAQIATERDHEDVTALTTLMQKVQQSGFLRSRLDMTRQIIMALVTSHIYLGLSPLFQIYSPNVEPQSKDDMAQAREFIVQFITHGLIADSGETNS